MAYLIPGRLLKRLILFSSCLILCIIFLVQLHRSQLAKYFLETYTTNSDHNKYFTGNTRKITEINSKSKVIIHTYMRSGSSFTAKLLAIHPQIFYLFEPLHSIDQINKNINNNTYFPFIYKPAVIPKTPKELLELYYQTINSYLHCRLSDLDVFTLSDTILQYGTRMTDFFSCYLKSYREVPGLLNCLPVLQQNCDVAKAILIKTIRSNSTFYNGLMKEHNTLKIMHLVRDPRATLYSHFQTGEIPENHWKQDLINVSKQFCSKVLKDIKTFSTLEKMFPGRIITLLYEDVATNPVQIAEEIHKFVKIDFRPEERLQVFKMTSTGTETCQDNMCTYKANSTLAALKWRETIGFDRVTAIDAGCGPLLYKLFGFKYVTSLGELRDLTYSLRTRPSLAFFK